MLDKIRNSYWTKVVATILIFEMVFPPFQSWALTGGPSQPEFSSFTPASVDNMVDLFTGDFSYNIPLMEVDGYPINISYSSGIGVDDQASMVGLGWTLNAGGIINRAVRGIPDDFNGNDSIITTTNLKPNWTVGVGLGFKPEIIGFNLGSAFSTNVGISYNNYNGIAVESGATISFQGGVAKTGESNTFGMGAGLSLNQSTESGLSITPSFSLSYKNQQNKNIEDEYFQSSLEFSSSFNTRGGLRSITISPSYKNKWLEDGRERRFKGGMSSVIPIGLQTYVPQLTNSMTSFSICAEIGTGIEGFLAAGEESINGFYSRQYMPLKTKTAPAFGYLYSDLGANNDYALHDFNREKDQPYNENIPAIALTQMTYDIYSVSGQGVSGMFRPFRDVSLVYDPKVENHSGSGSAGVDISGTNIFKAGINGRGNVDYSYSGRWSDSKAAIEKTAAFHGAEPNKKYEKVYFKNAGDFSVYDDEYFDRMFGAEPVRIKINESGAENSFVVSGARYQKVSEIKREARAKRNLVMTYLTAKEASVVGLNKKIAYFAMDKDGKYAQSLNYEDRFSENDENVRKAHHISEITVTTPDGARYVYGDQQYNFVQKEVSFNSEGDVIEDSTLIEYKENEASIENKAGDDNYFNCNVMPAYANSYLLTAQLSPDYVDLKGDGPTPDDLGTYTKINYAKLYGESEPYKWRNPYNYTYANFQDHYKSSKEDNKATYLYGEKEIKYIHSVESKNHIAIFFYSPREDGYESLAENIDSDVSAAENNRKTLMKLDKISLYVNNEKLKYALSDGALDRVVPIQTVIFNYDYSLCKGIPSNICRESNETECGKLTLKSIAFKYFESVKAEKSPYYFSYGNNPDYKNHAMDRWGSYSSRIDIDNPYVPQENRNRLDSNVAAWSLSKIELPSGGVIDVEYESDDYAFVQDKRATQMVNILGFGKKSDLGKTEFSTSMNDDCDAVFIRAQAKDAYDFARRYLGVKADGKTIDLETKVFFKFFTELTDHTTKEYINGYGEVTDYDFKDGVGCIVFRTASIGDHSNKKILPMQKAAIQYIRLNKPEYYQLGGNYEDNNEFIRLLRKLSAGINDYRTLLVGVEKLIYNKKYCRNVDTKKSFLRLCSPSYSKNGGGLRVKKITINDQWGEMKKGLFGSSDNKYDSENFSYGQTYSYTKVADGNDLGIPKGTLISSGVATYEPAAGIDECALRSPDIYNEKVRFAPDNKFIVEKPYGESYMPSPSVGYSQVTVTPLKHDNVTRTATGCVVNEFYTAKDFPVHISAINIARKPYKKPTILEALSKQHDNRVVVSQSYAVELNDMHGKQKSLKVYPEGGSEPISSIEYFYKTNQSKSLRNEITTITKDGLVNNKAKAGLEIDMVFDERESVSTSDGFSIPVDVEGSSFGLFPLVIPSAWPSISSEYTRFRSISCTKVITRYGILDKVVAKDLGSNVETKNLAWDNETGEVMLTRTVNEFNDSIYSFNLPAHWVESGMGPAYQNVAFEANNIRFSDYHDVSNYFCVGDEILLCDEQKKVWVLSVDPANNQVVVIDEEGNTDYDTDKYNIKIIRSGYRNQQSVPVQSLTMMSNPIKKGKLEFPDVVNAGAVEYESDWDETLCEQFSATDKDEIPQNPFLTGKMGNYRVKRSWVYQTPRVQSNLNRNTNIRKDGVYQNFSSFYQNPTNDRIKNWEKVESGWTFASEATLFSPYGFELENRDALGRYSSSVYGYNFTLPMAVSFDSKYKESGNINFEDVKLNEESYVPHFTFDGVKGDKMSEECSHSGRTSVVVSSGEELKNEVLFVPCSE